MTDTSISISREYLDRLDLAAELTEAARNLDQPPSYEAGNHVKCRGEQLSTPIYWQGRQWAVTPSGIECRDGTYFIARDRLWQNDDRYSWVRHMAGKVWVDLEDFAEALRIARRRYRDHHPRHCRITGAMTVAFTPTQKREHRQKSEVQQKQREYKKNWNQANREHVNKYMRDRYRARVESGSTTKQTGLFDGDIN
jgi:hypothetical protein